MKLKALLTNELVHRDWFHDIVSLLLMTKTWSMIWNAFQLISKHWHITHQKAHFVSASPLLLFRSSAFMVSHPRAKSGDHKRFGKGYMFLIYHDLERSRNSRVIRLYRQDSLKVSRHSAKFGGNRQCGSEDEISLIYQVILKYHVIQEPWNFVGRNPQSK